MRRWFAAALLLSVLGGCDDDGDGDDAAEAKKAIPLDQVPAVVLKAARKAEPDLTFFAAYKDKFKGQDSIELKGKTKNGKIKEVEVSPEGKVLGIE